MKRQLIMALAIVIALGVVAASASGPTTRVYDDITQNGLYWLDSAPDWWDLTQCDLTVSYRLDMSGYTPPMWQTESSTIGVGDGAWGWMSSGAPAAAETDPDSQDLDDKFILAAPDRYDEQSYDATDPDTLVTPPIGDPWSNYGIWFDRDGVDPGQAQNWGTIDGKTYNTGGIYDVVVSYHAINPGLGTMFATVNDAQTGFYDNWRNDAPHHYPVGKSISGDLTKLRAFASIRGQNVNVYDLTITGCLYAEVEIDIRPDSYPNSINLKSKGVVPVVVLTTADFDASTVDPTTVHFAGAPPVRWTLEDVDNDHDQDMLFHFNTQELDLDESSTEVTLAGDTTDGKSIRGVDTVNILPK